uniref:Transposase n=1 Tax=Panagrellus redivivus TaxID=6233 RepID=A0A7E5A0A4_PANRE
MAPTNSKNSSGQIQASHTMALMSLFQLLLEGQVSFVMTNPVTKHTVSGDEAPTASTIGTWQAAHPGYRVDMAATYQNVKVYLQQKRAASQRTTEPDTLEALAALMDSMGLDGNKST